MRNYNHKDWILVYNNGKYGVVNIQNRIIIVVIYEHTFFNKTERIIVQLKEKYGVINSNGKAIIPVIYQSINERKSTYFGTEYLATKNNMVGLFDSIGNPLIPLKFKYINGFCENGLAIVSENSRKKCLVNKKGIIISAYYNNISYDYNDSNSFQFEIYEKHFLIRGGLNEFGKEISREKISYDTLEGG